MVTIKYRGTRKVVLTMLAAALMLSIVPGCAVPRTAETEVAAYEFTRSMSDIDYTGLTFTPWNVAAAAAGTEPRERTAYTIMIYMNGSDLESENGAATLDISEILDADVDEDAANVIIFTGGTQVWRNNIVPETECVIWRVEGGEMRRVAGVGLRNMGDPGTLSSFIEFTKLCFPADKYGLIMWDHGGGSIAGYGHDENFEGSRLTLLEMDYAWSRAGLDGEKLEFIGFDACLMATVEMAVVASGYARYLVASEDLEPGEGWNYAFLSVLNDNPEQSGAELGRAVVDSFMSFYGRGSIESLTMSVTDLEYAGGVMGAMGALMTRCIDSLAEDGDEAFTELSRARNRTATFGGGSVRDNDCDMVDVGDMAERLAARYPGEAAAVRAALDTAVVYNRHNSRKNLSGLTAYYIYGGKADAAGMLAEYAALGMSGDYTGYLLAFASELVSGGVTRGGYTSRHGELLCAYLAVWMPDGDYGRHFMAGLRDLSALETDSRHAGWPAIGGVPVCLEKTGESGSAEIYAAPARLNGLSGDVIVVLDSEHTDGAVMGFRREEGYVVQKGLDEIQDGDTLAFYRAVWDFASDTPGAPELSGEITVSGDVELSWTQHTGGIYDIVLTDTRLTQRHVILPIA